MENKLTIYNTLSRQKELFVPLHAPHVGMYVCGPTVYGDFFNDTATTEIYTLSLHDALPIWDTRYVMSVTLPMSVIWNTMQTKAKIKSPKRPVWSNWNPWK